MSVARFIGRLTAGVSLVIAVVATGLIAPQHLAWAAPETRSDVFSVTAGEVVATNFPVTHAVVSWTGDLSATVQLRGSAQQSGGETTWQPWRLVQVDEDTDAIEGLVLMDDARRLEVGVTSGRADNLRIRALDTEHGPRSMQLTTGAEPAAAIAGATPQPSVSSRSDWGANEALRKGTPTFADIERIVVHHTVTSNDDPNPAATVRAIYQWHTEGNGWDDIGYNFLIDQQGRVYEGRRARSLGAGERPDGEDTSRRGVVGAHAQGANAGSVGISMLGTFTSAAPTSAQLASLAQLIAWKGDRHDLDLMAPGVVVGHRDVGQSSCPGDVAYSLLGRVRQDANSIKTLSYPPGNTPGYWLAAADGRVIPYGSARNLGSMAGQSLNGAITSMSRTRSGNGYWLMGTDGGIFGFGDARFHGSMGSHKLNRPVVGLAPTPSGNGYWLVASDGGIFAFGDARFHGSTGSMRLNQPVVGMAPTPSGNGYWLVASDGGIFAFGDARFHGSTGSLKLAAPVVTIATKPSGDGYWLMAADGGVFAFDAPFWGSVPMLRLNGYAGTVQATATATGNGYYMLGADGGVYTFGDARFHGAATGGVRAAAMALLP